MAEVCCDETEVGASEALWEIRSAAESLHVVAAHLTRLADRAERVIAERGGDRT